MGAATNECDIIVKSLANSLRLLLVLFIPLPPQEKAAKLYDEAAGMFDGMDDKDVYAVQPLNKVRKGGFALACLLACLLAFPMLLQRKTPARNCPASS